MKVNPNAIFGEREAYQEARVDDLIRASHVEVDTPDQSGNAAIGKSEYNNYFQKSHPRTCLNHSSAKPTDNDGTWNLRNLKDMEGHHQIARFMGQYDDCAIFKRFYDLNMQNLLYYQAEIASLREEFNELAHRDLADPGRALHHRNWQSLSWSQNEEDMEQWGKWLEIREKLKEYNDALAQVASLSKFKQPDLRNLSFLQDWLERPSWGNFPLRGKEGESWNDDDKVDLIAIKQEDSDSLPKWFTRTFIPFYHKHLRRNPKNASTGEPISEFTYYPESRFTTFVDVIRTMIATLLPISSIVTLTFVTNLFVRLGLAVGFTVIFSVALMLVTQGRRVEVFAATSAFAAIQVVFIGGNGGFVS